MTGQDYNDGDSASGKLRLWRRLGVLALFALLAVAYTWPYFQGLDSTSRLRDWVVYQSSAEVSRRSAVEFHQLPQWDPWRCGGSPHLADPQVDVLSPWFLVQAALGVTPAIRLHVTVHLFIAMAGMFWWARRRQLSYLSSLGAAFGFGLSGFFAANISWGLMAFLPCAYFPVLMFAYEAARKRWLAAALAGAVLALILYEGGFAAAQIGLYLLLVRTLFDLTQGRQRALRGLLIFAVAVGFGLALAAPKLLPTLLLLLDHPLPKPRRDILNLTHIFDIFVGRDTAHRAPGFTLERFYYFNYMGPLVGAAALWGLWRIRNAPFKELYFVAGFICLLLLGFQGTWMPYYWLNKIELLRWLIEVPSRFAIALGMVLALVFGYALNAVEQQIEQRRPGTRLRFLLILLLLPMVADIFVAVQGHWRTHPFANDALERQHSPFQLVDGDKLGQYQQLMNNRGTVNCHQTLPFHRSRLLRRGVHPLVWLKDSEAGKVQLERFSPNRLTLDIQLDREMTVLVNQNSSPGWKVSGELPARVTEVAGLLAVTVAQGSGRLVLQYQTPGLYAGGIVFVIALLLLLVLWRLFPGRSPDEEAEGAGDERRPL